MVRSTFKKIVLISSLSTLSVGILGGIGYFLSTKSPSLSNQNSRSIRSNDFTNSVKLSSDESLINDTIFAAFSDTYELSPLQRSILNAYRKDLDKNKTNLINLILLNGGKNDSDQNKVINYSNPTLINHFQATYAKTIGDRIENALWSEYNQLNGFKPQTFFNLFNVAPEDNALFNNWLIKINFASGTQEIQNPNSINQELLQRNTNHRLSFVNKFVNFKKRFDEEIKKGYLPDLNWRNIDRFEFKKAESLSFEQYFNSVKNYINPLTVDSTKTALTSNNFDFEGWNKKTTGALVEYTPASNNYAALFKGTKSLKLAQADANNSSSISAAADLIRQRDGLNNTADGINISNVNDQNKNQVAQIFKDHFAGRSFKTVNIISNTTDLSFIQGLRKAFFIETLNIYSTVDNQNAAINPVDLTNVAFFNYEYNNKPLPIRTFRFDKEDNFGEINLSISTVLNKTREWFSLHQNNNGINQVVDYDFSAFEFRNLFYGLNVSNDHFLIRNLKANYKSNNLTLTLKDFGNLNFENALKTSLFKSNIELSSGPDLKLYIAGDAVDFVDNWTGKMYAVLKALNIKHPIYVDDITVKAILDASPIRRDLNVDVVVIDQNTKAQFQQSYYEATNGK